MNKNEKSDLPLLIEFCVVLLPLLTIIYLLLPWIEIGREKRGKNEKE